MNPITTYQVPFNQDGDQCREEPRIWQGQQSYICQMRDNIPFVETLEYIGYAKSHTGGVYMTLQRITGGKVHFFLADFATLIPLMNNGRIRGEFAFIKRGPKYGCYMLNNPPSMQESK